MDLGFHIGIEDTRLFQICSKGSLGKYGLSTVKFVGSVMTCLGVLLIIYGPDFKSKKRKKNQEGRSRFLL